MARPGAPARPGEMLYMAPLTCFGIHLRAGAPLPAWHRRAALWHSEPTDPTDPPEELPPLLRKLAVATVACGWTHSLAMTVGGLVFAWGSGANGQLGLGGGVSARGTPSRVPVCPPARALAAGSFHSLAVAGDGRVFSWGWGARGRLGRGAAHLESWTPQHVRLSARRHVRASAVAAGAARSFALTEGGALLWWGWRRGKQGRTAWVPKPVPQLAAVPVHRVCADSTGDCVAAVSRAGGAFAWGDARTPAATRGALPDIALACAADECGVSVTTGGGAVFAWRGGAAWVAIKPRRV